MVMVCLPCRPNEIGGRRESGLQSTHCRRIRRLRYVDRGKEVSGLRIVFVGRKLTNSMPGKKLPPGRAMLSWEALKAGSEKKLYTFCLAMPTNCTQLI